MKKIICFFGLIIFFLSVSFAAEAAGVSGFWRTYNLKGVSQSIVKMAVVKNTVLGEVVKILPINGQKSTDRCTKCKGEDFNKPILGMTVVQVKNAQNSEWMKGKILDPNSGKIYKCKIRLADNGKILQIHAYIGFSLFGRTVDWARIG